MPILPVPFHITSNQGYVCSISRSCVSQTEGDAGNEQRAVSTSLVVLLFGSVQSLHNSSRPAPNPYKHSSIPIFPFYWLSPHTHVLEQHPRPTPRAAPYHQLSTKFVYLYGSTQFSAHFTIRDGNGLKGRGNRPACTSGECTLKYRASPTRSCRYTDGIRPSHSTICFIYENRGEYSMPCRIFRLTHDIIFIWVGS